MQVFFPETQHTHTLMLLLHVLFEAILNIQNNYKHINKTPIYKENPSI